MKILVTGAAGFIGMHTAKRLLDLGHEIIGLDNFNDYYDVQLKRDRLAQISNRENFEFLDINLEDKPAVNTLFKQNQFARVVHLAAQPGVRYSLQNPHAYVGSNIVGFLNILEGCRHFKIQHLVFASSSSVYGANTKMPYSEHDGVDHPISLYAATKKSNELMAHTYSHLFGLPTTGLRFFTVYGPWGRPDMSPSLFASAISSGSAIDAFNYGKMRRDFTYVDDIVEGVVRVLEKVANPNPKFDRLNPDTASSYAPYRIYNIGNNQPVALLEFIGALEKALGKTAVLNLVPMQEGDVESTWADIDDLKNDIGFSPTTPLDLGVGRFISWYKEYYANRRQ